MEEDAGKSTHVRGAPHSLVDYSRAGVPLVEIVSEPDLRSAREAADYLRELRSILRTLGVCDGNMEQGSFRCDANVSIRARGAEGYGERCELKNINSFRFVEQALEVEILRHARVVAGGGRVEQETRLFDPERKETRTMRSKEEAEDYRYFPDPDLPPLVVPQETIAELEAALPELPAARRRRWMETWGVPEEHARAFAEERALADFFDAAVAGREALAAPIAHLVKTEVLRELKDDPAAIADTPVKPEDLGALIAKKEEGKISSAQVKKLFGKMWREGTSLEALLAAEGEQISDPAVIGPILDELVAAHPKEVEKLRAGNAKVAGFFVGQVMKRTRGKADPALVNRLLREKIAPA
jgi:aspartyl-tRNA(Asn)/glutamyl-tRNA(Gln) amidotransferase subunit B